MTYSLALPLADPELAELIVARLELVEERLRGAVTHADLVIDNASRHLVDAGGKRLRPLLTLLTGQLGDGQRPEVVDAAVAVELIHLATLYHDDVMDSAPLRRGTPAAHEVWGNTVAILTGDLLLARASGVVSRLGPEAVLIQAETFERLCLGQLHEAFGPQHGENPVEHYLQVLSDKTGSLIATSARYGALLSGCEPSVVAQVTAYGELAGVAFQLADDVIDLRSDAETTGKTPGTDLREGVATMPILLLRERVEAGSGAADAELLAAVDGDLTDDDALAEVVSALGEHGVVDETSQKARQWGDEAIAAIAGLPSSEVKDALVAFVDSLVVRAG